MFKRIILPLLLILIIASPARPDEGMWIPLLLKKYNIEQMQKKGFKLTAEDIYSINKASLKDAVMIFGGGCTGELISDQGLLITNYHCGYRQIQQHSSVEHDYLTNGFWAMSKEEELPNPGLTVTFLKRMEDVTDRVLKGVTDTTPEKEREAIIRKNIKEITKEATAGNNYQAIVKPFFYGNQYFLFINEIFKDVRLVGAPPSAIGKFGGDTDNWMWPRHTGDFSVFRIYADKNNKPAEYSKDNVPYKPVKHFTISLKEVKEGDFTMVFGYPGSTYEYVPSYHIKMLTDYINPKLIDVRTKKLDIMNNYQEKDPKVRIQYAAKNASVSNSWKRWIGENKGLAKLNAIEKKQEFEKSFIQWCKENPERNKKYGSLLEQYKDVYSKYAEYRLAYYYTSELMFRNGIELAMLAGSFKPLTASEETPDENLIKALKNKTRKFFKDYYQPLDKDMTSMLLKMYKQNVPEKFLPDIYSYIDKHFKGDIDKYTDYLFKKSIFTNESKVNELLNNTGKKTPKQIEKDPAFKLYNSFIENYKTKISPELKKLTLKLNELNRKYMAAQMEFEKDKVFYPDANFTLRVAYGNVKGYDPRDAVHYKFRTTLKGIIEKDNPEIYDYNVPQKLKELYKNKDYGQYETDGTVPVCFVATNHTTGGNSGSPVLNDEGQLIGINFDRAWEGVMSDLMFNPEQCRNISLDMHYMLFLIDKFAGAGYLLDEMTIVK
ncbi:MAG: S46 family peptidase [Chlorobi bacterium]|nr:S46 family peptidase [Chlorobiota bacterium]